MATTKSKTVSTAVVITSIEKSANPFFNKLEKLIIDSPEQYAKAGEWLKKIKEYKKDAEGKEGAIINPIKTSIKNTQALFRPFYERVADIEATTKAAMLEFVQEQDKKKAQLQSDFESGKVKRVSTYIGKVHELEIPADKNSQVRKVKRLVIEDAKKIPRELMLPNETLIKKLLLEGKSVPGCKMVEDKTIAV